MRSARSGRSAAVLLGALLLAVGGCSLVGNTLAPSTGPWSVADLEQGLTELAAAASTDQVVEFSANRYSLYLTLLPESGEPEYLKWSSLDDEVTPEDGEGGYVYPQDPAAGTVGLDDIDLEFIVENEPCERSLEFTYRTLGLDGAHTYLKTDCSEAGETDREVHFYLDGRPLTDPDLTDPAALAQVTETAREYTGQPTDLFSVGLHQQRSAQSLEFRYTASTPTGTDLQGFPCLMDYARTTAAEEIRGHAVQTSCKEPRPPEEWRDSFGADLFDPEVLLDLWHREVSTADPDDRPEISLGKFEKWDDARYSVHVRGVVRFFDLQGNPLN